MPAGNHPAAGEGLPGFQRDPCLHDVAFDPGRAAAPRVDGAAHVAFDGRHDLGLCDLNDYVAQSHTLQACCVRFGRAVAGRARNTHYQAGRYSLPGRDLPPLDHAGFAQRTPTCSGIRTFGSCVDAASWLSRTSPFAAQACATAPSYR